MTNAKGTVVFVAQQFPPEKGGKASRIHDTATNLSTLGWDVTVLSPTPSYPPGQFERDWSPMSTDEVDGVTVHRLFTWQPTSVDPGLAERLPYYLIFGVFATLWLLWNLREYDVVVTSTPPISTGAPGLVVSALGIPWLVDVRDLWIDNAVTLGYIPAGGFTEQISRRFQRTVLRTADSIAVTTPSLNESLKERYGRELGTKTVVVPNGVDTQTFEPDETAPEPVVIYTGNLGRAQALSTVVEAMDYLDDDLVFRLVGAGNAESDLRALSRKREVQDAVEFTGVVDRDQVPRVLNQAMVGVVPLKDTVELEYAMPTKLYEYMACGLPTVVTGSGEVERFVEASGGGLHVENDPERVATAIQELVADPERREELARNGRRHVREHYDRRQIAMRLSAELETLVARGGVKS